MAKNADPDQLASPEQKPSDLDLHCLQRQDISGFSKTRVNLADLSDLIFPESTEQIDTTFSVYSSEKKR